MRNPNHNSVKKKQDNKTVAIQTNKANEISDIQNRIERCWNIYNLVNSWIEKTDNKVNVSIAIFTASFGVITYISQTIHSYFFIETTIQNNSLTLYKSTYIISVIFWLISIVVYLFTIFPKMDSNSNVNKQKKKDFPIFFKDIARMKLDQYRKLMLSSTDKQFLEEIIAETHINSSICNNKIIFFRVGVILSLISLIFAIASLLIIVTL